MTRRTSHLDSALPLDVLERIDRICDRFEEAWRQGDRPRLEDYLDGVEAGHRLALQDHLLAAEIACRHDLGETPVAADYQERFPEQAAHLSTLLLLPTPLPTTLPVPPGNGGMVPVAPSPLAHSVPKPPLPRRYDLKRLLGQGGMGDVWLGRDLRLRRPVAVKVVQQRWMGSPNVLRRFVEEAQLTSQLQHPGIPPVYERGELPDGRPYFCMKVVRGRTLASLLEKRAGPADDLPRLLGIFAQVCQAVAYAHSKAVIHRDLKPANVMVGAFGEVQVMDWGLAKVLRAAVPAAEAEAPAASVVETDRTEQADDQTAAGTVMGTYAYMPPEQARGEVGHLDRRCDVFGLGAILCEILTGNPPYVGTPKAVQVHAQAGLTHDALKRLESCAADSELTALARSCLGVQAADRPGDVGSVAAAVAAYLAAALDEWALHRRQQETPLAGWQRRVVTNLPIIMTPRQQKTPLAGWQRLLQVARAADPDAWRNRLRATMGSEDLPGLRRLLDEARPALLPLPSVQLLGQALLEAGDAQRAAALLVAVRDQHPGDVWINYDLARALRAQQPPQLAEAIRYYTAAQALRPEIGHALGHALEAAGRRDEATAVFRQLTQLRPGNTRHHNCLGNALVVQGRLEEAKDEYRKAIELDPKDASPHYGLGNVLFKEGRQEEAKAEYRKAIELKPDIAEAHCNLGHVLLKQGRLAEALASWKRGHELGSKRADWKYPSAAWVKEAETLLWVESQLPAILRGDLKVVSADDLFAYGTYLQERQRWPEAAAVFRQVLRLQPDRAHAHAYLAWYLERQGDLDGAIAAGREAIRLNPKIAGYHNTLGYALQRQGHLRQAADEYREALRLDPKHGEASANMRDVGPFLQAEARLPLILKGDTRPADNAERLKLARVCRFKQMYHTALRFCTEALHAEPVLAEKLEAWHRYDAACYSALAGCGQGVDAPSDGSARARLRQQALDWLQADLALSTKQVESGKSTERKVVQDRLRHWQQDSDLAGLRDDAALAKLSAEEREACQKFWADVAALLKKPQGAK
jgi:serine/threonine-protein kinase